MKEETNFAADQFAALGIAPTPYLSELEKDPFLTGVAKGLFNELLKGGYDADTRYAYGTSIRKEISDLLMGVCWGSDANKKLAEEFSFLSALVLEVAL